MLQDRHGGMEDHCPKIQQLSNLLIKDVTSLDTPHPMFDIFNIHPNLMLWESVSGSPLEP